MAQYYLFPCSSCDKDFEVDIKSAGMDVSCPFCEQKISLPGMRQIKTLPIAQQKETSSKAAGPSATKRFLFAAGLLVAVLGSLSGLCLSFYADSLATELKLEEKIEFGSAYVDTMTPGRLWETWDMMATKGLPDWQESQDVRYNKQAGYLKSIAYGLLALGGLGLLSLLASFFVRGKNQPAKP